MQDKAKVYLNWSGGKDSSLCLYKILEDGRYTVDCLLTNVNGAHDRISMHGVRRSVLVEQSLSIGIPLQTVELPEQPSMNEYEQLMLEKVSSLKRQGYAAAVFGDIFLEDLRSYREEKLNAVEMPCIFPLWKKPTAALMQEFLALGFKAIVVCINEKFLDKSFCGRLIDESFVNDLPAGVDVCGENGEYHSFVFDGPIFGHPVAFSKGEVTRRTYNAPGSGAEPMEYGFYFCDLII